MARIAIAVSDLMFRPRIEDAVRALGHEPLLADTQDALDAAVQSTPDAAFVDIHDRAFDANGAIRSLAEAGARVLAFGRHTEPGALRAARDAGAIRSVPRSQLVEELPALVRELADRSATPRE